jgi:hypothetical protein
MNDKIVKLVDGYIRYVLSDIDHHVHEEKYKFDALRHFQETFNIEAVAIADNLKDALSKVDNLAVGMGYYPVASLCSIAANAPDATRDALRLLFSEDTPEKERISQFQQIMIPLSQEHSHKKTSHPYNMDLRFISLLLSLRFPTKFMYFKATQIDTAYASVFEEKTGTRGDDPDRIIKARDFGLHILHELESRPEFHTICDAMGCGDSHNLWFAQDAIWHETTGNVLLKRIQQFIDQNPNWRHERKNWQLTQEQIDTEVAKFQERFTPDKLKVMSDEELLRWIPYRAESTNDGLSYLLEHSRVIGKMGGIGGGSAGKMGYYQGKDGSWKTLNNKVTTQEDVVLHRRIDVEVLSRMYDFLASDNWNGLKEYTNSLKAAATDELSKYKAVIPGLVWVRKYFTVLFPDKFLELYSTGFVEKLEAIAGMGKINNGGKDWDFSLWYRQMNKIAAIGPELNVSNYELSRIVWELVSTESEEESEIMEERTKIAKPPTSLNTIIYGPPGTGKTYSIKQYKQALLSNQVSKFSDLILGDVKEALLYLFDKNGNTPSNPFDIWRSEEFQQLQEYNGRTRSNGSAIRNELAYNTIFFRRVEEGGRVLYQATDDGLEHIHTVIETQRNQSHATSDDFYEFVTFHQSYGYEEFIEGIRAETKDNGSISYAVRDGVFKAFCRRAESDLENNYLFVIDEINRGNISKVFGELITLLEPNKRLGASEGIKSTLPYSGEAFGVPKNVHIIGTMNTADRSIALLDIALRRRFDFKEIMPDVTLLAADVEGINLQRLLSAINSQVVDKIDRNHQIGHSYLMEVDTLSALRNAWYQRIIPLLQEYFYDDTDDLRGILKTFISNDEVIQLDGETFKKALLDIYEEAQNTDSGIQL